MTFSIETAILDYLSKQEEPVRKSAIADNIPYTIGSIKNATPRLVKAGYVAESRGYYAITSLGRSQLEADPFFTTRPKKNTNNSIIIEIPIDELTLVSRNATWLEPESLGPYLKKLQTLAIMYAVAAKVPLTKLPSTENVTKEESLLMKEIGEFITGNR